MYQARVPVPSVWLCPGVLAGGGGDDKLHVFASSDFINWTDTSGGVGNYTPPSGGLRDPKIIYRPSDGVFFCGYTCGNYGATDKIGIARSTDGVNWTHVGDIAVTITALPNNADRRTWAACLYLDPDTEEIWCGVNAVDIDDGVNPNPDIGMPQSDYMAKAMNADLTVWSGTGSGTAPWALATVTGLPGGRVPKIVDVFHKSGATYYALVFGSSVGPEDGLGNYFVCSASNPLGPWTVLNAANNLHVGMGFTLEGVWLWKDGRGDWWQVATSANGEVWVDGLNGYRMRRLGPDLANLDTAGSFEPLAMDFRGTQGLSAVLAVLPRTALRAVGGGVGSMGMQQANNVDIRGGKISGTPIIGQLMLRGLDDGYTTGGIWLQDSNGANRAWLGVFSNEHLALRLHVNGSGAWIINGAATAVVAEIHDNGDIEAGFSAGSYTGAGFIVKSPNGSRWRLTVSNAGVVGATAL